MFRYVGGAAGQPDSSLCVPLATCGPGIRSLSPGFDELYAPLAALDAPIYSAAWLLAGVFHSSFGAAAWSAVDYKLRFGCFVGLRMDDAVWNQRCFRRTATVVAQRVAHQFSASQPGAKRFMSDEHVTVDGTRSRSWASQKKLPRQDGSDTATVRTFASKKRTNKTHDGGEPPRPDSRPRWSTNTDGYAERYAALLWLHEKQRTAHGDHCGRGQRPRHKYFVSTARRAKCHSVMLLRTRRDAAAPSPTDNKSALRCISLIADAGRERPSDG